MSDSKIFYNRKRYHLIYKNNTSLCFTQEEFIKLWTVCWAKIKCKTCKKKMKLLMVLDKNYDVPFHIWMIPVCSKRCGYIYVLQNIGEQE
jgi:hypothetical protein